MDKGLSGSEHICKIYPYKVVKELTGEEIACTKEKSFWSRFLSFITFGLI